MLNLLQKILLQGKLLSCYQFLKIIPPSIHHLLKNLLDEIDDNAFGSKDGINFKKEIQEKVDFFRELDFDEIRSLEREDKLLGTSLSRRTEWGWLMETM